MAAEHGAPQRWWSDPGYVICAITGVMLCAFALTVNFPKAAFGFQSDGATYYSLGHSLAKDWDFAFERRDLERVWEEFPTGPEGIFLKKGRDVEVHLSNWFPFVEMRQLPDSRADRLYYAKSYLYPLAAAPLVALFGTNGFLLLHALILTLCLWLAYTWLAATTTRAAAIAYAVAFVFASAAPVYLVWLTPEVLNLGLVFAGTFLWSYKLVATSEGERRLARWLRSPGADVAAAALLGLAAFSKPTNVFAMGPLLLGALWRRQRRVFLVSGTVFASVVAAMFAINVAITGEWNYQGGERNTFYGGTGFPFQQPGRTFDNTGLERSTNTVPTDVLVNRDALVEVFPRNLVYFTFGRHTGLVPYFFPGVLSVGLLALAWRRGTADRWFVLASIAIGAVALLLYMPFTYSGGGGPIGNRYFLPYYALFLFLTPPLRSVWPALVAAGVGGLFTAQLVFNPFYVSFHPGEHMKAGLYRWLPVELSLLNDLPVNVSPSRIKQPLGGDPPVLAYFLDDNAYNREGEWFWVRGESRAELILRAPARLRPDGGYDSLRIRGLTIELRTGDAASRVQARSGGNASTLDLGPQTNAAMRLVPTPALPYRAVPGQPTNYIYLVSISSSGGFVPLFTAGSRDGRYLGAMIRIAADYE
jgi:hypothetical protein